MGNRLNLIIWKFRCLQNCGLLHSSLNTTSNFFLFFQCVFSDSCYMASFPYESYAKKLLWYIFYRVFWCCALPISYFKTQNMDRTFEVCLIRCLKSFFVFWQKIFFENAYTHGKNQRDFFFSRDAYFRNLKPNMWIMEWKKENSIFFILVACHIKSSINSSCSFSLKLRNGLGHSIGWHILINCRYW